MLTKDDFIAAITLNVGRYPTLAALYQAGDPRFLQAQGAIAQMAAMLSQQIEIGMIEPFSKSRDSTLLADAALKGIVPMAVCSRLKVLVENGSTSSFNLQSGRKVLDSSGNIYEVDAPLTLGANSSGFAELTQVESNTYTHTIGVSSPFYKIRVNQPDDGRKISGISLFDSLGREYRYAREFTNILPDERAFNIECDEYRNIHIVLGYSGVVAYQPSSGEVYTVIVRLTSGDVSNSVGSTFAFEYAYSAIEPLVKITMDSVLVRGADPMDIPTLRELCKYPSIYDSNAVFLGEFDLLVRKNVPNLKFLAIWNEALEESVRGASVNNINSLFVSFVEPDGASHSATLTEIKNVIKAADDSYRIVDVAPIISNIAVTVDAQVARVNDLNAVQQSIEDALLSEYGIDSVAAKIGMTSPNYKRVYEILKQAVPALQDNGADFTVSIAPIVGTQYPEHFRYMTAGSVSVTVTQANYNLNRWGR